MRLCPQCGRTNGKFCRGVCNACYQRAKYAGKLDTLPGSGRIPGQCKRGHVIADVGRDTRGACRECARDIDRERKSAERKSWKDGTCRRGHDITDPANLANRRDGKRECLACSRERQNPDARRRVPGQCINGHDLAETGKVRADGVTRCTQCQRDWQTRKREADRATRVERAAKPKPRLKTTPKPAPSKLPPGWERTGGRSEHRQTAAIGKGVEVPLVQPTPGDVLAAARETLARLDALDLAAMLGLDEEAA
jgi:hypothetical protein